MFEASTAGTRPALLATLIDLPESVWPKVELVVAEGGGVVSHPAHQLQLAANLTGRGAERGPHAVVTGIQHQHGTLSICEHLSFLRSVPPGAHSRLELCRHPA